MESKAEEASRVIKKSIKKNLMKINVHVGVDTDVHDMITAKNQSDLPRKSLLTDNCKVFEAFQTIEPNSMFSADRSFEIKYTALERFTVILCLKE